MYKFNVIETNDGFYINNLYNENHYYNGKKAEKTFNNNWVFVKEFPEKFEILKEQNITNIRFELIDESNETDIIKKVFMRKEVQNYNEEEYEWVWKAEYKHLQSLYKYKFDKPEPIMVLQEFEINNIFKVDKIKEYDTFSYTIDIGKYGNKKSVITQKDVSYQIMDTIVFPDIVLSSRPCKLSSKQTYDIIRKYIKTNINIKYAKITSDYDFCFSVEKNIKLNEPIEYSVNINAGSRRKPKYETRFRNKRSIKIFEMTNNEDKYKGYTVIEGFSGNNHNNLKNKIDTYLKNLIDFINEPLIDCPHCNGEGVILQVKNFDMNKRD